ncbi:hypothetical protein JCM19992_04300 [Thermostilla marina]
MTGTEKRTLRSRFSVRDLRTPGKAHDVNRGFFHATVPSLFYASPSTTAAGRLAAGFREVEPDLPVGLCFNGAVSRARPSCEFSREPHTFDRGA